MYNGVHSVDSCFGEKRPTWLLLGQFHEPQNPCFILEAIMENKQANKNMFPKYL